MANPETARYGIDGKRLVHVRSVSIPAPELERRVRLYILTDPFCRKSIDGRRFISQEAATLEGLQHGWRVLH